MLTHISIKNFALIKALELDLVKGLTVLTGETGSGKSIILGALGLVLGERADIKSLGLPSNKCVVEATFSISDQETSFFEKNNLDFSTETIFRREIASSGKSRAFINDTPVTLSIMKELGDRMVDIHSQHQNSILHQQKFQFAILDSFAGITSEVTKYQTDFLKHKTLSKKLLELQETNDKAKLDHDYYSFQLDEMQGIDFENIKLEELEQELQTLNNAEEIKAALNHLSEGIEWSEQSMVSSLNDLIHEVNKVADYHGGINDLKSRLESINIELKDIRSECDGIESDIALDTPRASKLSELLDNIFRLQQKHRVNSMQDLVSKKEELQNRIHQNIQLDSQIEKLIDELNTLEEVLNKQTLQLSNNRNKTKNKLKKEIETVFAQLGLEKATINIVLSPTKTFNEFGKEKIGLEFCANPGSVLQPIEKVASGGEISRVMLALKAVFSKHTAMPTLILDEIDNGVSGEIGKRLGTVMKSMSDYTQLITITHLPQIAGKGDQHLKVFKKVEDNQTSTYIKSLNQEDRIDELAEMISGKKLTSAAKENAKELMN